MTRRPDSASDPSDKHVLSEYAEPSRPGGYFGVRQPIQPDTPVHPPEDLPSDRALLDEVRHRLAAEGRLDEDRIEVCVCDAVVELHGTAALEFQRTLAGALAESLPGVLNVKNLLSVRD